MNSLNLTVSRWIQLAGSVLLMLVTTITTLYGQDSGNASQADSETQHKQAKQEFDKLLDRWKALIKEEMVLKVKFVTCEEHEVDALRQRWNEITQEGTQLIAQIKTVAKNLYMTKPGADRTLVHFLAKLATDDMESNRHSSAREICKMLIDNGDAHETLYRLGGLAAFACNDFDLAEQYLNKAQETVETLRDDEMELMAKFGAYKRLWKAEQAVRAKEAEADDLPRVRFETTKGVIIAELFENEAPETVGNFVSLIESGFYDGLTFHRVVQGFVAQTGCPNGDGSGDPGYQIRCECHRPDARNHFRGTLSMAHRGVDTGGSQFFFNITPFLDLNGEHTVFGRVLSGFEAIEQFEIINPQKLTGDEIPDRIIKAEVIRKRDHEYKPVKIE